MGKGHYKDKLKKTAEGANQLNKFYEKKIMLNIWIGQVVFQNKS